MVVNGINLHIKLSLNEFIKKEIENENRLNILVNSNLK